ncbi:MAG TPA: zf-HC2 domain-containing protein, partial [Pyrinomonadaceae bacterium]
MRCEDCLPLIEEYFDGEVTGQTGEQIGAHLSACATCGAALDALSFEQEVYARYDRGGLEVTPDLWARVSAEIARTPPTPESPAAGRPFLSRARVYFAAALGALSARPALASSLALLVVAAGAGALWLSRKTQPAVPAQEVARNIPAPPAAAAAVPPAPG